MSGKINKFIRKHKFTTGILILDIILFILLFPTQGITWILLSIIFWITLIITVGSFSVIRSNSLIDKKLKKNVISLAQSIYDKKFMTLLITIMLVILGILGFFIYIMIIPNFKGYINEGYLHETVNEIIKLRFKS